MSIGQKWPALLGAVCGLAFIWWRTAARRTFAGRVMISTGGSRGPGLALARRLACEKADLALIARDEEELERAKTALSGYGSIVNIWRCDVRNEIQLGQTIQQSRSDSVGLTS